MSDVQRYTVSCLDGTCGSRIDARSFSDAAEDWARYWLDEPDQSDVLVTLGTESKTLNVVCERVTVEGAEDLSQLIYDVQEITT